MKAEFEAAGQKVEVDFTELEQRILDRLDQSVKPMMEKYMKELKSSPADKKGKGVIEGFDAEKHEQSKQVLVEEFRKGERLDPHKVNEQWTICVPKYAVYEVAGHLRDYVFVTDVIKGKPGETVNIPYVNDIDFEDAATPHTSAWSGKSGLINVLTTTLKESGTYYDAYYGDIEKIDSNMLEEINRVFAHAAVRSEDRQLIALINSATSGQFLSEGGGTDSLSPLIVGTSNSAFALHFISDALAALMRRGKEVHPGECILYVTAKIFGEIAGAILTNSSATYSFARPEYYKGMIEDFFGVKIVVGGKQSMNHNISVVATTSYEHAYLMRPKRALALAPKRDILIETDKLIKERQLRIAGSHTYGVAAIDYSEVVIIVSNSFIA